MWLINAIVALFLSALTYFGIRCIFDDAVDLSVESVNGIVLFTLLYLSFYKGADYLTKGY
jgi:hypothetical protein